MRSEPNRVVEALVALAVVAFLLATRGMGRSLWLDEAWVANSAITPHWKDVFYYPGWLQTTPPLFLLLERILVGAFGLSNTSLRLLPLLLAGVGWLALFHAVRFRFGMGFGLLAVVLVALNATSLEYAHTVKQYSGEMAVSALLLWAQVRYSSEPTIQRFALLALCVCAALALGYSSIFLVPGTVIAVGQQSKVRAALLVFCAGVVGAVVLGVFILPNYSSALREFWRSDPERSNAPWIPVVASIILAGIAWYRLPDGPGRSTILICGTAAALVSGAALTGFYPATARTFLFIQPLGAYALIGCLSTLRISPKVATVLAALVLIVELRAEMLRDSGPFEDVDGAMAYLQKNIDSRDLIVVHPSLREPFLLYALMRKWSGPEPIFGTTGWPCCIPDHKARERHSESEVGKALDSLIPNNFRGRVWLLYTTRPPHWDYVGMKEGDGWRKHLWERGCPPGDYQVFQNVAVSPMECSGDLRRASP